MRRWLALALTVLVVLVSSTSRAADPKVVIDGRALVLDVAPVVENGRTLVPLRPIFNALGATVDWSEASQTATASKDGVTIKLTIGQNTAYRNGAPVALAVPAKVVNNRTMVPLRFVSEALGAQVGWDDASQTATITSSTTSPPPVAQVQPGEANIAKLLPGLWSAPGSPELPDDPALAVANDQIVDGEWYLFGSDGTFLYVWMGSNPFVSGAAEARGKYRIEGNQIILTGRLESWFSTPGREQDYASFRDEPGDDKRLSFTLKADGSLMLGEDSYVRGPNGTMRPEDYGPVVDANPTTEIKPAQPAGSLVGLWSSNGPSGDLVDPSTGAFQRSYYSGEWYLFRDDGTYRYVIVGAGQFISGAVVREGKFRIEGQKIVCYENNDDWYPDPKHPYAQQPAYKDKPVADETLDFELSEDGKTLKVGLSTTLYRAEK